MSLGLNLYSGIEAVGPHLNATGFQIYQIANTYATAAQAHDAPDGYVFVVVKNLSTSNNADIQLRSDNPKDGLTTDDFAKNGTYAASISNTLTLEVQDLLYGRFNKLFINRPPAGTSRIFTIIAPK